MPLLLICCSLTSLDSWELLFCLNLKNLTRNIVLSALFVFCAFRICCQRRLTRWWSGPLGVRSSGWTVTSSVASSRPHPETTLSSSCSLPCSLKGSVLSAGMHAHTHTHSRPKHLLYATTWHSSYHNNHSSVLLSIAGHNSHSLLQVYLVHWSSCTVEKSVSSQVTHTHMHTHKHKCPRPAHLGKHRKQHYITRTCGSRWHLDQRDFSQPYYQRGMNKFHRTRPTRPTYPLAYSKHLIHWGYFPKIPVASFNLIFSLTKPDLHHVCSRIKCNTAKSSTTSKCKYKIRSLILIFSSESKWISISIKQF